MIAGSVFEMIITKNHKGMGRQTGLERSAVIRTSGTATFVKRLFRTAGTE